MARKLHVRIAIICCPGAYVTSLMLRALFNNLTDDAAQCHQMNAYLIFQPSYI